MAIFRSDEPLWYNNGVWGQLGYAVPNVGNNHFSLNSTINYLVSVTGRNLSAIMHTADADMRVPPSINTLTKLHKLIVRARAILAGRGLTAGTQRFEGVHNSPGKEVFLLYPCPYFKVRNFWLKEWCGYMLGVIGEMAQHSENRQEHDISVEFAGTVGQYYQRVYVRMATELLQVPAADAAKPDFTLTDAQLSAYNPAKWFTSTEMIDYVPNLDYIPTEDDLRFLTDGIPANQIVNAVRYPDGSPPSQGVASGSNGTVTATATVAAAAFAPPPSP